MKGLSIEEKAKAYDKAITKSVEFLTLCKKCGAKDTVDFLEDIFPELKESKDEKIRKTLIRFHKSTIDVDGIKGEDIIAWLENLNLIKANSPQLGEQKPIEEYNITSVGSKNAQGKLGEMIKNLKPADKVEPFDKFEGLTDFERTLTDICIGWIGEELGWKQYIKDNADVLLKIAIKKFNSIQDAPFEQKPAEWSEEDEEYMRYLHTLVDNAASYEYSKKVKCFLKSLRPRTRWKPSEEQMEAVKRASNGSRAIAGKDYLVMESLYNDLEKLTE